MAVGCLLWHRYTLRWRKIINVLAVGLCLAFADRHVSRIDAPLLQFWHHGVTDLSSKPSKSSRAKAKP